jgi:hypothetical protein
MEGEDEVTKDDNGRQVIPPAIVPRSVWC